MRILVTGASGLLGLNLALEACREHTVFGVVNHHRLSTNKFTVIEQDLLAEGAIPDILDKTSPDWIVHCAAQANIDLSEADPEPTMQLNAGIPGILAQETARRGLRLVHISTDAVFDGKQGDYSEEDAPNPLSVYARSKLEGERKVLSADPNSIVARVNLFGWSLNGQRSLAEIFINNLIAGRKARGFTDVFFCPLFANDLARVLIQMLELNLRGLYHAVSRDCTTKYAFGLAVAGRFGLPGDLIEPISVEQSGLAARRSPNLTLRTDKLAQALGTHLPSWEEGIERFHSLWLADYPGQLKIMGDMEKN